MAKVTATSGALPAFKFRVRFGDIEAGFNMISGLSQETEVIEYRTGDEESRQHLLRGLTMYDEVEFQQGLIRDPEMIEEALSTFNIEAGLNQEENYVFDEIVITQRDQAGNDVLEWTLENGWISNINLEDYDANATELQFLNLTVRHEGLKFRKLQ